MAECPKCNYIAPLEDFLDAAVKLLGQERWSTYELYHRCPDCGELF